MMGCKDTPNHAELAIAAANYPPMATSNGIPGRVQMALENLHFDASRGTDFTL
jgi:hypothetical protein